MLNTIDWKDTGLHLAKDPNNWLILGGILLCFYLWRLLRKHRQVIHLFSSECGTVTVSRNALAGLIKGIVREHAPKSTPRVSLSSSSGKLAMKLRIRLFSSQNVPKLTADLKKAIAETLNTNLGIDQISKINITISHFTNDPEEHVID